MAEKKVYKNKNGFLDLRDFIYLIHNREKLDKYMRGFTTLNDKCPPMQLISGNQQCFFCIACINYCKEQVKEYKTYYKVGKNKYNKEEIESGK